MMAQLHQQQAGTLAEGFEGVTGIGDRHGAVDGTLHRVAGEVPERTASVDRPFLEPVGGVSHGPDFPEVEAGAFEQNGRGEFHRTQRADGAAVASRLSPDAMKLKAIRANLAALESVDWTVVHDADGRYVLNATGPMDERQWRVCSFDHDASKDEMALISSAPETIGFLLGLVDRAWRALRPSHGVRDRRGETRGEPQVDPKNYAAEAAMKCQEPAFLVFLEQEHGLERPLTMERAAQKLRSLCGVTSRKQLNDGGQAAEAWRQLRDAYAAWKKAGR